MVRYFGETVVFWGREKKPFPMKSDVLAAIMDLALRSPRLTAMVRTWHAAGFVAAWRCLGFLVFYFKPHRTHSISCILTRVLIDVPLSVCLRVGHYCEAIPAKTAGQTRCCVGYRLRLASVQEYVTTGWVKK